MREEQTSYGELPSWPIWTTPTIFKAFLLKQGDAKTSHGYATRWLQHCFLWVLHLPLTIELTGWLSSLRHGMPPEDPIAWGR